MSSKDEVKRRIEVAFASGDFSVCRCRICGTENDVSVYRIEGEPEVYCFDCAHDPKLFDGPSPSDRKV